MGGWGGFHCGDPRTGRLRENVVGQLVMLAATTNISKVVDMEAVRAAIPSCQRFTALYLCSPKLSGLSLVCAASGVFCWTETIFSTGRKLSPFLLAPLLLRGVLIVFCFLPGVNIADNLQLYV